MIGPEKLQKPSVLVCDDDPLFKIQLKRSLEDRYEVFTAEHCDEAIDLLRSRYFNLFVLDINIRTPLEGLEFLPGILKSFPDLPVIVSSSSKDFNTVRNAIQLGAQDFLNKDQGLEELGFAIERVLSKNRLIRRFGQMEAELKIQNKNLLIGESPPMLQLKSMIHKAKRGKANVLITGETGTGKEVVAKQFRETLQDGSLCPFVSIDSATIQSSMAESILFGHEKGAFTGADKMRRGLFEEANGGIIYFDELANMPIEIQAKLLRVVQEKEVTRLGSGRPIPLDFRIVAATNQDLEELSAKGGFKFDLYQRISVIPIQLPPLRERKEDIPLLIAYFSDKIQTEGHLPQLMFSSEATQALCQYSWPGNIRELENVLNYLATFSDSPRVELADLPQKILPKKGLQTSVLQVGVGSDGSRSFYEQVKNFEKSLLEKIYLQEKGKISAIAKTLQMDRSHLYSKLREYGIHPKS